MSRLTLLIALLTAGSLFAADAPPGCKPTKSGRSGEVAFVVQPLAGTWNDVPYNKRTLAPHLSVCVDSEIHLDGKPTGKEQLVLRDLFGNNLPPYTCAKLLNCQQAIKATDIAAELQKQLKGKTPGESFDQFKRNHSGQTSTISRGGVVVPRTNLSDDPWYPGAVARAGEPLHASALAGTGALGYNYDLDLCLNVDQVDCGKTLPKKFAYRAGASDLPFGAVPPGLHMLYQVRTLDGDTVPLRTEDRAFVLVVDPSLPPDAIEAARIKLSLAWLDADATPAELTDYVYYLAAELDKPNSSATQKK